MPCTRANGDTGYALHELVRDEAGRAVDYRFLEANPAFSALTGLEAVAILGKTVREVIHGVEDFWIERYARVVDSGETVRFSQRAESLGRDYEVRQNRFGDVPRRQGFLELRVSSAS